METDNQFGGTVNQVYESGSESAEDPASRRASATGEWVALARTGAPLLPGNT